MVILLCACGYKRGVASPNKMQIVADSKTETNLGHGLTVAQPVVLLKTGL